MNVIARSAKREEAISFRLLKRLRIEIVSSLRSSQCRSARPYAELDAVAVAIAVVAEPLIVDAMALRRRVERIAPADALAVGIPEAARQHAGAGDDRGAVGEMHRADRLAGELAGRGLAA